MIAYEKGIIMQGGLLFTSPIQQMVLYTLLCPLKYSRHCSIDSNKKENILFANLFFKAIH